MTWVELDWFHDPELLGRIGRSQLASILDMLSPFLAQQNITLPDITLPETLYFAKVAAILRSQPLKVVAYLPPFLAADSEAQPPNRQPSDTTVPPEPDQQGRSFAAKVFQLLTALDPDNRLRKAPPIKVFNLYYRQGLQPAEVAYKCKCHRSLIFDRLAAIQKSLPWTLQQLREVSPQVEAMEDAVRESRAKRIYRKEAISGDEEGDEQSD
jgi:hypothetical protein